MLDFLATLAVRENVVRASFSNPIYFSRLLDAADGSRPEKYVMTATPGTIGLDGEPVRTVSVIQVALAVDEVTGVENPAIVDLTLDRPMTAWPALYTLTISDVYLADLSASVVGQIQQVQAVYRKIEEPQIDLARPTRDIANAQTLSAAQEGLPNPDAILNLGTIQVDDTGDYAFDEGLTNLKKRVYRRLVTSPGRFAHLPNYGVGVLDHGKKLATAAIQNQIAAEAQAQIAKEPDVRKVSVRILNDRSVPGLVRFQIAIVPKSGAPQRFDVPFTTR